MRGKFTPDKEQSFLATVTELLGSSCSFLDRQARSHIFNELAAVKTSELDEKTNEQIKSLQGQITKLNADLELAKK